MQLQNSIKIFLNLYVTVFFPFPKISGHRTLYAHLEMHTHLLIGFLCKQATDFGKVYPNVLRDTFFTLTDIVW